MKVKVFIIVLSIAQMRAKKDCDLPKYDFEYQNQVSWTKKDIWSVLKSFETTLHSCKIDQTTLAINNSDQYKLVFSDNDCSSKVGSDVIIAYKNGKISRMNISERTTSDCFEMSDRINFIQGTVDNGQLEGKVRIKYADDDSEVIGTAFQSVLQGQVIIKDPLGYVQSIGHYVNGLPHGPYWILPSLGYNQYMYVHFNKGYLVMEKSIVIDTNAKFALMGNLNQRHYLEEAEMVDLEQIAEYKCMTVLKIPQNDPQVRPQRIPSPYCINSDLDLQRIMIRPAKILFYNRVAKTGSQSITALLRALEKKNEFVVDSVNTKRELLIDTSEGLQLQLTKMLRTTTPMVFVQHYSFIDFSKFGYDWSPDWFNIVRDPIEKVISYFYYRRAGWVIADRLRVFPDDKLESVDYFKKDFESCVLQDDPECRFSQNELNNKFGDHRGQIMQFCGQEPVCRLFNNPEALQIAKKNVERHYAVVGITENMNMTLTVAEKKMPQYFRGAKKIYFNDPEVIQARSANFYKFPVSPEVKTLVRKKFKHEIEFYEFCKQRLIAQLNEL